MNYEYDDGGLVIKVYGEKKGETFPYIDKIHYDLFGQRSYILYGNGVKTSMKRKDDGSIKLGCKFNALKVKYIISKE